MYLYTRLLIVILNDLIEPNANNKTSTSTTTTTMAKATNWDEENISPNYFLNMSWAFYLNHLRWNAVYASVPATCLLVCLNVCILFSIIKYRHTYFFLCVRVERLTLSIALSSMRWMQRGKTKQTHTHLHTNVCVQALICLYLTSIKSTDFHHHHR